MTRRGSSHRKVAAAVALILTTFAARADAGERQFGYTYEPRALAPGNVELEQWITPRLGKAGGVFARTDLRTELEVGVVEDLQTAIYLNLKNVRAAFARPARLGSAPFLEQGGEQRFEHLEFEGISNEWLYKVSDPVADPVGFALYIEWGTNGQEFELEEKLIVAKTAGPFTLAANLFVEHEWRAKSDESPHEGTFGATLGAAFKVPDTGLGLGLEYRTLHVLDRHRDYDHSAMSLGPVVHYASKRWWATLTFLPQLASQTPSYRSWDYDAFEVAEVRLIIGVEL